MLVPAGTRVGTCADDFALFRCEKFEVQFRTLRAVRIPFNGHSEPVSIEALEPGPAGNVEAGEIAGVLAPGLPELWVRQSSPTTGGADEQRGLVAQADVDRVVAAEGPRLRTEAEQALRARARDEGLELADDVRVEMRTEVTPPVGAVSPTVEVTVTVVATASGFRPAAVRAAAEDALGAAAPPGRFLVPGTVAWDRPRPVGGKLAATARARVSAINTDGVARALRGRRASEAEREMKARHGAGSVEMRRRPLPLPFLPFFSSRIRVEILSSS